MEIRSRAHSINNCLELPVKLLLLYYYCWEKTSSCYTYETTHFIFRNRKFAKNTIL